MRDTSRQPNSGFHVLAKPSGPICNLDCQYCFYLEKERLYPGTPDFAMSEAVLDTYVRSYIEAQDTPVVSFAWQGGEPTLRGVEFFETAVDCQARYANGRRIENAFQTNGILLDDRWGAFLKQHDFLVGLSIDGPRPLHDGFRIDKGGGATFDKVLRGLQVLQAHQVRFNTLTVVHRTNAEHPLEVYRFLKEIGSRYMQFIPVVERLAAAPGRAGLTLLPPDSDLPAVVAPWSVEPRQYGEFLSAIFDEWVRHDVARSFVQMFDVALELWMGLEPGLCVFRRTCGSALALEHNGDLYSCDHYVYPENRLGNIMDQPLASLVHSAAQVRFGQDKHDRLPRYCQECDVRFACNGECPKHRFIQTPDGEPGLNYLCAGYKLFFHHIDPFMQYMASELRQQRPPANVMQWARQRDAQAAARQHPGRNEPCPCGSGRKYKKCCLAGRTGARA
ncbi:MAG: anaerobic sulfatase-maturation protein [Acidobacteria bacterium]|nr:anaerobic sulfatase-maturation protein [Acidobacteriota bacterium]